MSIIPFNPGGARCEGSPLDDDTRRIGGTQFDGARVDGLGGARSDGRGAGNCEKAVETAAERETRLERALIEALRESATNWARAERAERMLGERPPDARVDARVDAPADRG